MRMLSACPAEKKGAVEGSINELALHDLRIFKEAYDVDWDDIEKELGVHFISMIRAFHSPDNMGIVYSQSLRERIKELEQSAGRCRRYPSVYVC